MNNRKKSPPPSPGKRSPLGGVLMRGEIPGRWWGRGEGKRRLFYYRCWNKVKLASEVKGKPLKKIPHTLWMCADSRTEIPPLWPVFGCTFRHFLAYFGLIFHLMPMERLRAIARTSWSPVATGRRPNGPTFRNIGLWFTWEKELCY